MTNKNDSPLNPALTENGWEEGQTNASIDFVKEAEQYLETATDSEEIARLNAEIDAIRSGTKKLTGFISVLRFLNKAALRAYFFIADEKKVGEIENAFKAAGIKHHIDTLSNPGKVIISLHFYGSEEAVVEMHSLAQKVLDQLQLGVDLKDKAKSDEVKRLSQTPERYDRLADRLRYALKKGQIDESEVEKWLNEIEKRKALKK